MKLSRFFSIIAIVTILALMYVYQQVESVITNYTIKEKEENLSRLLDQNKVLMYNVIALKSPRYLEEMLASKDIELELPRLRRVVELREILPIEEKGKALAFERRKRSFFSIFALKSQAEAGTE